MHVTFNFPVLLQLFVVLEQSVVNLFFVLFLLVRQFTKLSVGLFTLNRSRFNNALNLLDFLLLGNEGRLQIRSCLLLGLNF